MDHKKQKRIKTQLDLSQFTAKQQRLRLNWSNLYCAGIRRAVLGMQPI
jgi:hypothetical protein